jgi:SAM-dependent methyltransferase
VLKATKADFQSELDWWETYLGSSPAELFDAVARRDAFPHFVLEHVDGDHRLTTLELGSGPFSLLAWGAERGRLDVTAIDPLAEDYGLLLSRYAVQWPVVPQPGCGESLPDGVRARSFDLVYTSNAIDHTQSPGLCVQELVSAVKPGGLIVFEGFCKEGTAAEWVGLHQHDLTAEDGHLMHRDRAGAVTSLTADLPIECLDQRWTTLRQRNIRSFGYDYLRPDGTVEAWPDRGWYSLVYRRYR